MVRARLQRGGLANRLFPWARAVVYSELHGYPMAKVHWSQLKVGPLLRRETDLRLYRSLFRPTDAEQRSARLGRLRWPITAEPTDLAAPSADGTIVEFTGLEDYFDRLFGHNELLRRRLLEATRPERLPTRAHLAPIAVHVRRGDFAGLNLATPIDWYTSRIRELRDSGIDERVAVLTDGRDDEVADLTRIPNVEVVRTGTAIGDLWVLACAATLVASSRSTFSAWGHFLANGVAAIPQPGDLCGLESRSGGVISVGDGVGQFDFVENCRRASSAWDLGTLAGFAARGG